MLDCGTYLQSEKIRQRNYRLFIACLLAFIPGAIYPFYDIY